MSHFGYGPILVDGANGTGPELQHFLQGPTTVHAWGTWDGATVTFEQTPDHITWYPIPTLSFTANGHVNTSISMMGIRAVVAGGLGSESINVRAFHRHQGLN